MTNRKINKNQQSITMSDTKMIQWKTGGKQQQQCSKQLKQSMKTM